MLRPTTKYANAPCLFGSKSIALVIVKEVAYVLITNTSQLPSYGINIFSFLFGNMTDLHKGYKSTVYLHSTYYLA